MRSEPKFAALWAILFNGRRYAVMRDEVLAQRQAQHDLVKHLPSDLDARTRAFRRHFWASLLVVVACVAASLVWASAAGQFTLDRPYELKSSKVLSAIGNALMGWGTWFMLANPDSTNKGWLLDENLRPFVFKLLFVPGLVLALVGGMWADIP